MTTKYLIASTTVIASCLAIIVAIPVFGLLPAVIGVATLIHILSSAFNGLLSPMRVLIIYFALIAMAIPFVYAYGPSRIRSAPQVELSNVSMFVFGFGIYLAIAFRILDFTIGKFREKGDCR